MPGVLCQGDKTAECSLGTGQLSGDSRNHGMTSSCEGAMDGSAGHAAPNGAPGADAPGGRTLRSAVLASGALQKVSYIEGRHMSLPRNELFTERRLSLQPTSPPSRVRSRSQPPKMTHSGGSPPSGEYLAELALQSALAPCALPTIRISQVMRFGLRDRFLVLSRALMTHALCFRRRVRGSRTWRRAGTSRRGCLLGHTASPGRTPLPNRLPEPLSNLRLRRFRPRRPTKFCLRRPRRARNFPPTSPTLRRATTRRRSQQVRLAQVHLSFGGFFYQF